MHVRPMVGFKASRLAEPRINIVRDAGCGEAFQPFQKEPGGSRSWRSDNQPNYACGGLRRLALVWPVGTCEIFYAAAPPAKPSASVCTKSAVRGEGA